MISLVHKSQIKRLSTSARNHGNALILFLVFDVIVVKASQFCTNHNPVDYTYHTNSSCYTIALLFNATDDRSSQKIIK